MVKLSNVFLGHVSINSEMVKRLNAICTFEWILSLEWILSPEMLSWATIVVGANFVFLGLNPGGHVLWNCLENFCAPGQHLTTLETLSWRIFPGRCPGLSWYFCTYDDANLISSYVKVCIRYGFFIYIHLQYVYGDSPNTSLGTLSLVWNQFHHKSTSQQKKTVPHQRQSWHCPFLMLHHHCINTQLGENS